MSFRASDALGVILAGGLGRRLGASKATAPLSGRPMISYPLRAMEAAVGAAVVVAKADTQLPRLPGLAVWIEPPKPRHPLTGLVRALSLARGRPVVVCPCDMPLVPAWLLAELAIADSDGAPAVIAQAEGRVQPLLARYEADTLGPLTEALEALLPMTDAVATLGARPHEVSDPGLLLNVNTPEDLRLAEALLSDQPNVKS